MRIFSTAKPKLALVFDLGSASVGSAIFEISKTNAPRIIWSAREPIVLLPKLDLDQLLSLIGKTLSSVLAKAASSGVGSPQKFFCILGPAWHASQARIIRFAQSSPFTFSEKLADELIQKEIQVFKKEHAPEYLEKAQASVPIELKSLRLSLNGYPTERPIGHKARELEMAIFVSIAGKSFLDQIEKSVWDHFHRGGVKFSTLLISIFTIVRDLFQLKDFILVDIGGEITSIALAKGGTLTESASFPKGKNFIVRELARDLGTSLDEVRSLLSLYQSGHAGERARKRLEAALESARSKWLHVFEETLAHLSGDISIPSDIFISAGEELAQFFSDTIQNEKLSQYTLTNSKFKITFLGTEALHGAAQFALGASKDLPLMIETIYINRYLC